MIVYRIEDANGRGPYSLGVCRKHDIGYDGNKRCRHAAPCDEGWDVFDAERVLGITCHSSALFGFASKRQLVAWFPRDARAKLAAEGCTIVRYRVAKQNAHVSPTQCVFNRAKARRVRKEPVR